MKPALFAATICMAVLALNPSSAYSQEGTLRSVKLEKAGLKEQAKGSNKTLGKLGNATMATSIYSARDIGSTVYYQLKKGEYIVVVSSSGSGWLSVLLNNGQSGYIQADAIEQLPFEVQKTPVDPKSPSRVADQAAAKVGSVLAKGTDSADFVRELFKKVGVSLPPTAARQAEVGTPITRLENLKKGDRVYFWTEEVQKIGQTGIYLGNGYFVMPDLKSRKVETHHLGDRKWLQSLVASRR